MLKLMKSSFGCRMRLTVSLMPRTGWHVLTTDLERARAIVYAAMPPTPQYAWPLLADETGCESWVKHENHTPVGAFKVRGGLVHMRLRKERGETNGVITATRGNHGQSIPFAARREGIAATVLVPEGNSVEKNAAMRALGAELIEAGADFDEARDVTLKLAPGARPRHGRFLPSGTRRSAFRPTRTNCSGPPASLTPSMCRSVSAQAFAASSAMRDMLGLETQVVGVVSEQGRCLCPVLRPGPRRCRPIGRHICRRRRRAQSPSRCRRSINGGAERIVEVREEEIAEAMRLYYRTTHNLAEGAGAAALAALMKERARWPASASASS